MVEQEKILKLISHLSIESDDVVRENAVRSLLSINDGDIKFIFFPAEKTLWEACAMVLQRIGFPRLERYIPTLLEWYKDLNWPGVNLITKILSGADRKLLGMHLEASVKKAVDDNDDQWLGGLKYLIDELKLDLNLFQESRLVQALVANDFY